MSVAAPTAAALAEEFGPRQDVQRFRISSVGWRVLLLVLIRLLFLFPVAYAVYLAFTNLQLLGPHAQNYWFTGFDNIDRMIHDTVFWQSAKLTLVFVVGSGIIAQTLLGMMLALTMRAAWAPLRLSVGALVILAWVLPEMNTRRLYLVRLRAGGRNADAAHARLRPQLSRLERHANRLRRQRLARHGILDACLHRRPARRVRRSRRRPRNSRAPATGAGSSRSCFRSCGRRS